MKALIVKVRTATPSEVAVYVLGSFAAVALVMFIANVITKGIHSTPAI